jgi:hypothetical protein
VPAIGAWFLMASAGDSLARLARGAWSRAVLTVSILGAVVLAAGASPALQRNMKAQVEGAPLPRSFVLRRSVLAERMCTNIKARWTGNQTGRLVLYYPGTRPANYRNIHSSLGYGAALKVLLARPGLDVVFVPPAKMPEPISPGELMVYSELGACYTLGEWRDLERAAQQRKKDGAR